jgi:hypothetical protein
MITISWQQTSQWLEKSIIEDYTLRKPKLNYWLQHEEHTHDPEVSLNKLNSTGWLRAGVGEVFWVLPENIFVYNDVPP